MTHAITINKQHYRPSRAHDHVIIDMSSLESLIYKAGLGSLIHKSGLESLHSHMILGSSRVFPSY